MALTGPYGVRGPNSGDPNKSSNTFASALAQLSKAVTATGTSAASSQTANPYGIRAPSGVGFGVGDGALSAGQVAGLAPQANAVVGPTSAVQSATPKAVSTLGAASSAPKTSATPPGGGGSTASNFGSPLAKTAFGKYISNNADFNAMLQNPEQISSAYYNFHNMPQHSGGQAMLNNLAPSLPLLYTLMNGSNAQSASAPAMMDWIGQYIDESSKPGGTAVGPQDVAKAIFSKDKNSLVFNQLYGADLSPTQQVGNVLSALRYGLAPSVPAPMLNSILARASDIGNNFITWRNTHPDGGYSFGDYLQQQGFKI